MRVAGRPCWSEVAVCCGLAVLSMIGNREDPLSPAEGASCSLSLTSFGDFL